MVRQRIRLHFAKTENLRFIGHRDLLRTMDRLFRRAQLPLAMSQGFHPKPKVSYLSALPLGYSGRDEIMEIVLDEELDGNQLLEKLNATSVDGLEFTAVEILGDTSVKGKAVSFEYEMAVPEQYRPSVREKIDSLLASPSVNAVKPNGKTVDVRPAVLSLALTDSSTSPENKSIFSETENALFLLRLTLAVQDGPSAGVREVLGCLGLEKELFRSIFPVCLKTNTT